MPAQSYGYYPQNMATPVATRAQVLAALKRQVEYYFSVDNLCRDLFLRQKMDPKEGWIALCDWRLQQSAHATLIRLLLRC